MNRKQERSVAERGMTLSGQDAQSVVPHACGPGMRAQSMSHRNAEGSEGADATDPAVPRPLAR